MREANWRFGVVGNIVVSHIGEDGKTYYGTKAFTPGTKVYIDGKYWSKESSTISVIGRNRFGRTVLEYIHLDCIENFRVQRIYKPTILKIIDYLREMEGWDWWGRTVEDRKSTEKFVKEMKSRFQPCDADTQQKEA